MKRVFSLFLAILFISSFFGLSLAPAEEKKKEETGNGTKQETPKKKKKREIGC